MRIFDAHFHIERPGVRRSALLNQMAQAGVSGGAVFSVHPQQAVMQGGAPYEARVKDVLSLTAGASGRLFPVLWIHPREENAIQKARDAKRRGVMAFKIICDCFYVDDPASMALLRVIAELDMPVFFHSGVLWDGGVSSKFNRPLNWEAMIDIPGLRFSLAHCAWPWIDECIALYGKFQNAFTRNPERSAEMFFDLTPGTPQIYREELLTKLFKVGYDTVHNILFGTDCIANDYNAVWARKWIETDNAIYDKLGLPTQARECVYEKNLMRFLGLDRTKVVHAPLNQDGSGI